MTNITKTLKIFINILPAEAVLGKPPTKTE